MDVMSGACDVRRRPRSVVLHLSQSQIATDPRILRAMDWGRCAGFQVRAVGVEDHTVPLPSAGEGITDLKWKHRSSGIGKFLGALVLGANMLIRSIRLRPDVIHCHQYYVLPVAFCASLLLRIPIVYDAHELESKSDGRGKVSGFLVGALERGCSRRFRSIVTVCEEIAQWYSAEFVNIETFVVYNIPSYEPDREKCEIEKIVANEDTQFELDVLYIGRVGSSRMTDSLLAFEGVGAAKIRTSFLGWDPSSVGAGPTFAGIGTWRYLGAADHRDVVNIARHFDVGVVLFDLSSESYSNSLPNKFWELIFAGIPILASRSSAIERVSKDFDNVLVVESPPKIESEWVDLVCEAAGLGKRDVGKVPVCYSSEEMVNRLRMAYGLAPSNLAR